MRTNKILHIILCFLMLLLSLSCQKPNESKTELSKEIRIGALLALTGSGANYGKSLQQGIELAKDEINKNGGIKGKKLKIIYEDSQGDAKIGVNGFNKLISVDKVNIVIGSISSVILSIAPIAEEKKIILLNSSAISPKICEQANRYLFSIMVSGAQEGRFMAHEYVKKYQDSPIAILYSNNSSGVDTKNAFVHDLAVTGSNIAVEESYELGTSDFRTQLSKIRLSKAKYAYLIAFSSNEFAGVLNQSKELGLNIQWYTYSGFETKETLDLASNAAEGVIYSYPDYSTQTNSMESFQKKYNDKYGTWADIYTVTSYDGVHLLANIISHYGTDTNSVRNGLKNSDAYFGIFGNLKFENNQCITKQLTWKMVDDGEYVKMTTF